MMQFAKAFAKYCKRKSSVGAYLAGVFLGDGLQALSRGGVKGNSKLRYGYFGEPASVLSSYGTPSRSPILVGGMHPLRISFQPRQGILFLIISSQALLVSSTHPSFTLLQRLPLRDIDQGREVERNFIPHHHAL
jgi:hypothetical protein